MTVSNCSYPTRRYTLGEEGRGRWQTGKQCGLLPHTVLHVMSMGGTCRDSATSQDHSLPGRSIRRSLWYTGLSSLSSSTTGA